MTVRKYEEIKEGKLRDIYGLEVGYDSGLEVDWELKFFRMEKCRQKVFLIMRTTGRAASMPMQKP